MRHGFEDCKGIRGEFAEAEARLVHVWRESGELG